MEEKLHRWFLQSQGLKNLSGDGKGGQRLLTALLLPFLGKLQRLCLQRRQLQETNIRRQIHIPHQREDEDLWGTLFLIVCTEGLNSTALTLTGCHDGKTPASRSGCRGEHGWISENPCCCSSNRSCSCFSSGYQVTEKRPYHLVKVWHAYLIFINHLKVLPWHQVQPQMSKRKEEKDLSADGRSPAPLKLHSSKHVSVFNVSFCLIFWSSYIQSFTDKRSEFIWGHERAAGQTAEFSSLHLWAEHGSVKSSGWMRHVFILCPPTSSSVSSSCCDWRFVLK